MNGHGGGARNCPYFPLISALIFGLDYNWLKFRCVERYYIRTEGEHFKCIRFVVIDM